MLWFHPIHSVDEKTLLSLENFIHVSFSVAILDFCVPSDSLTQHTAGREPTVASPQRQHSPVLLLQPAEAPPHKPQVTRRREEVEEAARLSPLPQMTACIPFLLMRRRCLT